MLELKDLEKTYGEVKAVDQVNLTIQEGEFFSLLGPSGCGKTTLLRMLGGFESPSSGQILQDGVRIDLLPPNQRHFNMVFQRYALFPHLNVHENIAFGLKMKKVPAPEVRRRVEEALALVKMEGFDSRRVATLSGGQQQRIALARALVNRPRVLLLDEPLSALDLKLRQQMQMELLAIQKKLKHTFIFVTHDQEEALTLSDRIAVMNHGVVEQVGSAREIYEKPRTEFVAQFIGSINSLDCQVLEVREGLLVLKGAAKSPYVVKLPRDGASSSATVSSGLFTRLLIRPEKLKLLKDDPSKDQNCVEGTLKEILYQGPITQFMITPADWDAPLLVTQPNSASSARITLCPGERVFVSWEPEDCLIVDHA